MKIAVECRSPLLQRSLELFLHNYLASAKKSDIIIRDEPCIGDEKRCFYIGVDESADLLKPFSKAQLVLALQKHYKKLHTKEEDEEMDFSILERRIDALTQEYKANILRAVKAFYEK